MTTATELIDLAAERIGARSLAKPLNSASRARMFDLLRTMLARWEANGLQLTITIPVSITDDLGEQGWATDAISYSLGRASAPTLRLSQNLDMEFKQQEALAWQDVQIFAGPRPQQPYPGNLPLGKGNNTGPRGRRYWPEPQTIDTEMGANITLETNSGN